MQSFITAHKKHTILSLTICSISAKSADVAPSNALRERLDDCKHKPVFKQCLFLARHPQLVRTVLLYFKCIMTTLH